MLTTAVAGVTTRFWRENTWDVVAGNADQGLLTHVFLAGAKRRNALRPATYRNYSVHHFWGSAKPWLLQHTRCLEFWDFLKQPREASVPESTVCLGWLADRRARAVEHTPLPWPPCGGMRLFVF